MSKIIGIDQLRYYNDKISSQKQDTLVSGVNIKTINGESLVGSGNINIDSEKPEVIQIAYAELKDLRNRNELIPGAIYCITDYEFTSCQEDISNGNGTHFYILVNAVTNRELLHSALAKYSLTQDSDSLKLLYDIDNDTTKYDWADEVNGRGVIYYMKDKFGNECPYDFKNAVIGGEHTFSINEGQDGSDLDLFHYNIIKPAYNDNIHTINRIIIYSINNTPSNNNVFGINCQNNKFQGSCSNNSFGIGCTGNTFGNDCTGNTFGNDCSNNNFRINCDRNTFSDLCSGNTFESVCFDNTFGIGCTDNTFIDNCFNNTFCNDCSNNTFGDLCSGNTFGNGCSNNTFGECCSNNTFGENCGSNTFGDLCSGNTFGNNCKNNILYADCQGNSFGNDCENNTMGFEIGTSVSGCVDNSFGNKCISNHFGYRCDNNSLGDNCQYNSLGEDCDNNSLGDDCINNSLGDNCQCNSLGNECKDYSFTSISHTSIMKDDEYYDDGSGNLVPVKHPDLSTQACILPYKFAGKYVYEQLIPITRESRIHDIWALAVDKPLFISAQAIGHTCIKNINILSHQGTCILLDESISSEQYIYFKLIYTGNSYNSDHYGGITSDSTSEYDQIKFGTNYDWDTIWTYNPVTRTLTWEAGDDADASGNACSTPYDVDAEVLITKGPIYNIGSSTNFPKLRELKIGAGIGSLYIDQSHDLTEVTIPTFKDRIRINGCNNLIHAILNIGTSTIPYNMFCSCGTLVCCEIPDYIEHIGGQAFKGTAIHTLTSNAKFIDESAFYGSGLNAIDLPYVGRIYNMAFCECKKLKTVTLGGNFATGSDAATHLIIENRAFQACESLEKVIFKESGVKIGARAFDGCQSLSDVVFNMGKSNADEIGDYAFNWTGIRTLTSNAYRLGEYAFGSCALLETIDLPCVESIGYSAFTLCSNLKIATLGGSLALGTMVSPDNPPRLTIHDVAFHSCTELEKVVIKESSVNVGPSAFESCIKLSDVVFDGNYTTPSISEIQGSAFMLCTNLNSIELPRNTLFIGSMAFNQCSNLKHIDIPCSVEEIENNVFDTYGTIDNVIFGTSIYDIIGSDSLTIGGSTINRPLHPILHQNTFMGANIKNLTCYQSNYFDFGENTLSLISGLEHIYLPESDVATYKSLWPSYADIISSIPEQN